MLLVLFVWLAPSGGRSRRADQRPPEGGGHGIFVESAAATGLNFTHINGASGKYYVAEEMGAGVALFDYDNDGDLDVFLVQGGPLDDKPPGEHPGYPTSRLFRNDLTKGPDGKPRLHFTDVTEQAGVGLRAYGMGAAVGDYDNDGYLDLFVTGFGAGYAVSKQRQRHVHGRHQRSRASAIRSGARARRSSTTTVTAIWISSSPTTSTSPSPETSRAPIPRARRLLRPSDYHPVPDRLFRNDGNGHFTDVTDASGISRADGAGLGVAAGDYNGDGWLDLYVANDATPNQLWINRHDGTFVDEGLLSGAALNAAGNPEGSMGIASGDFDADGDEDLFVTNIIGETFVLYRNDGHGQLRGRARSRRACRADGAR